MRLDADGMQRVDFLVELHGADLGREGAARAAGNDDGGEQHAELAQHADRHDVDHEDFRAVFARLLGGDVGDDQRDEERDQGNDGNGGDAGLVDVPRDRRGPQPPPAGAGAPERDRRASDEVEGRFQRLHAPGHLAAERGHRLEARFGR